MVHARHVIQPARLAPVVLQLNACHVKPQERSQAEPALISPVLDVIILARPVELLRVRTVLLVQ